MYTKKDIHKISATSPLVYTNMGWLGDGSHRGQVRQACMALGFLMVFYVHEKSKDV